MPCFRSVQQYQHDTAVKDLQLVFVGENDLHTCFRYLSLLSRALMSSSVLPMVDTSLCRYVD